MSVRVRRMSAVALFMVALVLLTVSGAAAQGTTVEVTLTASEFKFDPAEFTVQPNETVTFNVTNSGQFPHNVSFVAPDGTTSMLFNENLAGGQSRTGTFTFNAAGDWKMICPVGNHADRGMVGVVHVAAASGGQTGGTASSGAGAASGATAPSGLPTTGGIDMTLFVLAGGALLLSGLLLLGLKPKKA